MCWKTKSFLSACSTPDVTRIHKLYYIYKLHYIIFYTAQSPSVCSVVFSCVSVWIIPNIVYRCGHNIVGLVWTRRRHSDWLAMSVNFIWRSSFNAFGRDVINSILYFSSSYLFAHGVILFSTERVRRCKSAHEAVPIINLAIKILSSVIRYVARALSGRCINYFLLNTMRIYY